MRTSGCEAHQIILFKYDPSRSKATLEGIIDGFSYGFIQSDGYSSYQHLKTIIDVGCWGHVRRYFTDVLKAMPENKKKTCIAAEGVRRIDELFKLEKEFKNLTPEERYLARLEQSKPKAKEFFEWVKDCNVLPKTATGSAITYAKNQKEYLMNVFLDGRLELSNNLAENAIRPFVIGRKNWLFANTPNGADASAISYSIVETAKANGLIPYEYINYVLTRMSSRDFTTSMIPDLFPWSDSIPENCKNKFPKHK
jgi:prophage antirepressor-like protein